MVDIVITIGIILVFFTGILAFYVAHQKMKENVFDVAVPAMLMIIGMVCFWLGSRFLIFYFVMGGS